MYFISTHHPMKTNFKERDEEKAKGVSAQKVPVQWALANEQGKDNLERFIFFM